MKSGFSLIELLVVVGIIALLAAILIPAVQNSRNRAREAQLTSNLRQIGAALLSYAGENNQQLPLAMSDIAYKPEDTEEEISWQQQIDEYVDSDRRVFLFPNDPLVNSTVSPVAGVRGFFLGSRAAYIDSEETFARVNLMRVRSPSAYILGGEVRHGPFESYDADRDNYSIDPAFVGRTTSGQAANLLFADGSVRKYTHFDQTQMTTLYDGPGLEEPEW